ncbi:apolipoprotein N-acyltransferase [Undibacterium fentianense]|uniref:apolipoprotein N-acyltransferase n=1 Tax=Undibacterium fentianense TaxID=2828728 RepID=UPI002E32C048|nr:apolipoprotein N-acyltransferase [Undibacterium fentianense]
MALLLGALNVLAFAPYAIWPIQLITPALLLVMLMDPAKWNPKQAALIGLCYGFGQFVLGVCWLVIAMSRYGGMPWALSVIALSALASFMALFPSLCFFLLQSLRLRWRARASLSYVVIFPVCWACTEFLRGYLFTGFPWLAVGYAHHQSPLAGYAPIVGVYGLGAIAMLCSACLAYIVVGLDRRTQLKALFGLVFIMFCGSGLHQMTWTKPYGQPLSVRLTQGNIDQGIKFTSSFLEETLAMYAGLMTEQAADLIATPETALPLLVSELPTNYLQRLQEFSQKTRSHLVIGVVSDDGNQRYSNSVLGIDGGVTPYRYDKHHLVPFGEYVPFGFRWFVNLMQIPLGEYSNPGVVQPAFAVKDQRVMPNICYEDLFGEEIAEQLRVQARSKEGAATILLNVSNLAWFGDLSAIPQHLQISQMRSLETGRPMLRSTNTGATAMIDARGNVIAAMPVLSRGTLAGEIQGMQGLTPYIRFGNGLWGGIAVLALAFVWWSSRRQTVTERNST